MDEDDVYYLDHNSTTPCDRRVVEAMLPYFSEQFGNPASRTHVFGWQAQEAVDQARATLAACLHARAGEILLTSGATESNNLAIRGLVKASKPKRHLITQATEHPSVLEVVRGLERGACSVTCLPVDKEGRVDPKTLEAAITDQTALVSIMAANHEVGTLQPLGELGAICRARGVPLHVDAAQAAGKVPIDVGAWSCDLLSISSHKFYGPKGAGALYCRSGLKIAPLLLGGGHERGLRSGTINVPGVVGMARALELCEEVMEEETVRLMHLREALWARLSEGLDGLRRNGAPGALSLPGTLSVTFSGVEGEALLLGLPAVAVSSGSACSSVLPKPSHVLLALGLSKTEARGTLRFGLGRGNTEEEVERVAELVVSRVRKLRPKP